jgi:hypothetical protein
MKKNSCVSKVNSGLVPVLIIYSILGLFLLKYYQYQINPDGISYISIAQKYLNGDFRNAINGYWSPLLSWLLTPFLLFGLPSLLAIKLLSLIIGLLTIICVRQLSYRFKMSEGIRNVVLFSLIPAILFFSLSVIAPDLLLVSILVYYLNVIFDADYPTRGYKGVLCGALGATAYLSKNYAFPFFISHFLLFNAFHYFSGVTKERKKSVLRNLFFGLTVFFVISGGWIYLISNKYNKITIGTAGEFNYAYVGPKSKGLPELHRFLKPPNETAVSAWEDPSYFEITSWSPMHSLDYFKHQLVVIYKNIRSTIYICCCRFSVLSIPIIFAYMLLCIQPLNQLVSQRNTFYPLVTVVMYPIGYILLLLDVRFLWIIYVLLILMGGHLLSILFQKEFFNNLRRKIALIFFALFFVAMPLEELILNINAGKDTYSLSRILKNQYNIQGNIASNKKWDRSLLLSYYLNCKYYGEADNDTTGKDLQVELSGNNIDYYLVWDGSKDGSQTLSNYLEITSGEISGLRIYSLKENK